MSTMHRYIFFLITLISVVLTGCFGAPESSEDTQEKAPSGEFENAFDPQKQQREFNADPASQFTVEPVEKDRETTPPEQAEPVKTRTPQFEPTREIDTAKKPMKLPETVVENPGNKNTAFPITDPDFKPPLESKPLTDLIPVGPRTDSKPPETELKPIQISKITDNKHGDFSAQIYGNSLGWQANLFAEEGPDIDTYSFDLTDQTKRRIGLTKDLYNTGNQNFDQDFENPDYLFQDFELLNEDYIVWKTIGDQESKFYFSPIFKKAEVNYLGTSKEINSNIAINSNNELIYFNPEKTKLAVINLEKNRKNNYDFVAPLAEHEYKILYYLPNLIYLQESLNNRPTRILLYNFADTSFKIVKQPNFIQLDQAKIAISDLIMRGNEVMWVEKNNSQKTYTFKVYNINNDQVDEYRSVSTEIGRLIALDFDTKSIVWAITESSNTEENNIYVQDRASKRTRRLLENTNIKLSWDALTFFTTNKDRILSQNQIIFPGYVGDYKEDKSNVEIFLAKFN